MVYSMSEDSITAELAAPGGPFELERRGSSTAVKGYPSTLIDLYHHALGHERAVMTIADGVPITFEAVFGRAAALASVLRGRFGVAHGTSVAIAMANRPEWMISFIAVTALGGVAVLINSRGAPEELRDAILRTGCALVLIDGERATLLAEAIAAPPWSQIVLAGGQGLVRGGRDMSFDDAAGSAPATELYLAEVESSDGAAVLFTSGTTGYPRGALQTHGALTHAVALAGLVGAAADVRYAREFGQAIEPERTSNRSPTIIAGPLFHLGGIIPFMRCLYFGVKTILLGKWNPETAFRLIEREGVARLGFVPTMLWDMLRSPEAGPDNIGRVRFISSGAAAISPALTREITRRMPGCMLGNTYGSTETAGYVASICGRDFLDRPTSCGRVVPSVEVRLLQDDGADAAPGEPGEVVVRSPCVMKEYVGDPEGTAAALQDGWLRTGDIAIMDDAGLLHIVDRKKNMVISGGENIYCAEVERVLSEHQNVLEVLAYGVPDNRLGERLAVTIVPTPDAGLTEAGAKAYVAKRLAVYKVPREIHFREAPFARTASGKIDRLGFVRSVSPSGDR
jgi:long-chain acyl-CoA synthetase